MLDDPSDTAALHHLIEHVLEVSDGQGIGIHAQDDVSVLGG